MTATKQPDRTVKRASFDKPHLGAQSAQALARVGVVDIGSNSVRMVVFDGAARSPAYFFNEKVMCGLGVGLSATGRLNPQGRQRALAALRRFRALAESMGLTSLTVVATAAMRDAMDGLEFRDIVQRETGLDIWIVKGDEEARLSAQGVLLGWPGSFGLVCDIGGYSMELAAIREGRVGRRISVRLGPLKLLEIQGRRARHDHIKANVRELAAYMGPQPDRLFLVGGSWRAIARIDMQRRDYPLHVLHEYRMSLEQVQETLALIDTADLDSLRQAAGVSASRMALVPYAGQVLARLAKTFRPRDIALSSYGIREGLLYEQMPQSLRDRDPLIEACRFAEAKDARQPGFGQALYRFVRPLFSDTDKSLLRLVKAACLLHDVSWRAHPDYRADACFDYVTRASMGGLKHSERVFLGLSLLYRYRSKSNMIFAPLYRLLGQEDRSRAEVLGKAMRFGAMLWMEPDRKVARLDWNRKSRILTLILPSDARHLYSEAPESRFLALAQVLGAEAMTRLSD